MEKNDKILVIGSNDVAGKAIVKFLRYKGYDNISDDSGCKDLLNMEVVSNFFKIKKPEYVILGHFFSGGILVNTMRPADFIYTNLQIQNNIIRCSYIYKTKKLIFLASSCVYSSGIIKPIREESILSGKLEKTSEPYAIAKIAGVKMCEAYNKQYKTNFITCIPATVYGPDDTFDEKNAHVLAALVKRIHEAKINKKKNVCIWGTGKPKREFLYADDMASACHVLLTTSSSYEMVNVGSGMETSVKNLAYLIRDIIGYNGNILFDKSKPDGVKRKILNSDKILSLGWKAKVSLEQGIKRTYENFLEKGK